MAKRLHTIEVTKAGRVEKLRMHYTNARKMHDVAFALKRAGYTVAGEYDPPLVVDTAEADALQTAAALLS